MMNTLRALIALAGMTFGASIAAHAQAIEPHGNIGMPAPVLPAPGQNGAPGDGSALPEPELSLTKDGRAECVDWDRWSERPSVRCFYTITVKNNGSATYWGLISVEDAPRGAGPWGTVLKYRLAGWGLDTIWRRCLSTRTPGTGDTTPEGPFFCETHGGATGADGLAPGEEITLTIEVVVERQDEDFRFENCATLRWDWMRYPPGTDEAVRQRLGELGYVPLTWIEGASGDAFPTSSLALAAFQRDRGLPLTGEADEATLGALFPDGRWPFDANPANDHDCHSNIIPTQFDRSSYEQRDGKPQPLVSCPPGWKWTGKKCDRASRKPSGIAPPLYVPPAPPSCLKGMVRNAQGQCQCAKGTRWDGQRCKSVVMPPRDCPQGYVGIPPNCKKVLAPRCPPGTIGTPPYCKKVLAPRCPSGTIGTPPNCKKVLAPKCPPGTIGTPPYCKKVLAPRCPSGTIGTPPNCKQVLAPKCPTGTIGTPPSCKKIEAPF